ncbi:MAG: DUF4595 domain-containing protein [Chitinophagales bacterium]|nr:DUF4595 domain-containing protein [Chitinophagales bacterium]MCZ2394082.1 DUF4595 domain-containing protein [Chitinophagales bacterium]
MKSLKFVLYFFSIFIFALACKKEGQNNNPTCLIESIITNNLPASKISYVYDNQNRISEYSYDNVKLKFIYNGLSGSIQVILADTIFAENNITFDSQGRLTSYEDFTIFNGSNLRYYYVFKYNSEGYISSSVQTLVGGSYNEKYSDTLIYTNGNLTQKITKRDNTIYKTVNYTYSGLVNKSWNFYWNYDTEPFNIVSGFNFIYSLLGTPSTHLPSSIDVIEGVNTQNFSYDFLLNKDGQVTEYNELQTNSITGNTTTNYKFNIVCK